MIDRTLRARIILEEAYALGVDLADLIAAHATSTPLPTVSAYIDAIAPTFNLATADTYRPYWRLAAPAEHHARRASPHCEHCSDSPSTPD